MGQMDHRQLVLRALDLYELPLLRYALRLVGDEDLARDAVQHAFLKLWDARSRLGPPSDAPPGDDGGSLAPWLYRVCRNRCLDHLRTSGREQPLDAVPGSGRELDPADVAETGDLAACLQLLIAALPAGQQEAIGLWCEGLRYAQIAQVTGQTEGHVRVLVHRGFCRLREHPQVRAWLDDDESGQGSAWRGNVSLNHG